MDDFFRIRSTGLGRKLLFWIIISSSVITLLLTVIHLYFDYTVDREILNQRFQEVEQSHLPHLIANLWLSNDDAVTSQLDGINGLPDFVLTKLLDEKGQLLYQTESRLGEYLIKKEWPLVYDDLSDRQPLGTLVICAKLDNIYTRLIDKLLMILASQAVKTFLISLIILFIIYHIVTKRLDKVFVFLNQWEPGSGTLPPYSLINTNRRKPDELDELVTAIETMRIRLGGAFEKMQKLFVDMQSQKNQLRQVFEGSSDVILLIDIETQTITICNQRAEQQLGYSKDELMGKTVDAIFLYGAQESLDFYQNIDFYKKNKEYIKPKEFQMLAADGHMIPVEMVASLIEFEGRPHLLSLSRDIGERKRQEEKINYMAWYDSLTDLPNRALIRDRINQSLSYNQRHASFSGLIFVDLDFFKSVNDSLGHQVGDELLKAVGRCLTKELRAEDSVGRLGGDEFVVLLSQLGETEMIAQRALQCVAEKLRTSLSEPLCISEHQLTITASMGGTVYSDEPNNVDEVLRQADLAMYQSKKAGRNYFSLFSKEVDQTLPSCQRLAFINSLRDAQRNDEFSLFYQPIVDIESVEVIGIEALIRWNRKGQLMVPETFITQLCEAGLMNQVGSWVLEQACHAMMEQLHTYTDQKAVPIAVNISPVQFDSKGFMDQLQAILDTTALPPELLILEVTEDLAIDEANGSMERLHKVRDLGVQLALDDFGTGSSSLSYLKRLPATTLKIDQSFTCDILNDSEDRAVVSTIIDMAKTLRLEVVAEGVESSEQANALLQMGCKQAQGYYYMPPQPSLDKAMQMSVVPASKTPPSVVVA